VKKNLVIATIVTFCFIGIISTFLITTTQSQTKIQKPNEEPKIVLQQLHAENGIIPLEIQKPQANFKTLNTVENISFTIKNNTNKSIRALCVAYSIQIERDTVKSADTFFQTIETFVHKDIHDSGKLKPILAGEERVITDNAETTYESGSNVIGLEVRVDFVEFEDGTFMGVNEKGEKLISFIRDGASKYKTWLFNEYIESKKSITKVISQIQQTETPKELNFSSEQQKLGASIYRKYLLGIYKTRGENDLEKFIAKDAVTKKSQQGGVKREN
jgi:hypothetical protein